ncbi:hypothetical protein ACNKHV_18355 [Shigella flexneri]
MAKLYLPAIKDGADNSLVVDGPAVPHPACGIPQGGETRGNSGCRWSR